MIAKVLKWGNSYGLRITKEEARKAGLREGQEVVVEIKVRPTGKVDLSHIRAFNLGGDLADHHDEVEWA
ncbi:MAG: hypothetical protein HY556_00275 [Euryarchaeota archaeon]|nr:hypothetical protein [Euryarchaeota archaeon]